MKKYDLESENEIIKLYKNGMSQKDIAIKYNTYNTTIRRILLRNNILLRTSSNISRLCKHNPFKRNDEYSDYFLGLLITDGNIEYTSSRNRIRLSLSETDKDLINKFKNWASPKSKINKTLPYNNTVMYSCAITNQETVDWLERKGNFRNKSYDAKLYIPINYNILRGMLDGDGGFYRQNNNGLKFGICSASKNLIDQIKYFLEKNYFSPKIIKSRNLYTVYLFKQNEVLQIGKFLYQDASIFCQRKYLKWLAFYENKRANGVNSGKEMAIQS